jgi:hypothetical protein
VVKPGGRVMTLRAGGPAALWDLGGGGAPRVTELPEAASRGQLSPDGSRIVARGPDGQVEVWDSTTGRRLHTLPGHHRYAKARAFGPDGRMATGGEEGVVLLWDLRTGRLLCRLAHPDVRDPTGADPTSSSQRFAVNSVAFSPDGGLLAAGSADGFVRVWDLDTGRPPRAIRGTGNGDVAAVAFSPCGRWLASSDRTIQLWRVGTWQLAGEFGGRADTLAFTPDGQTLVANGWRDPEVRLWEVRTRKERGRVGGHPWGVYGFTLSPDGSILVTTSEGSALVWRLWSPLRQQPLSEEQLARLWDELAVPDPARACRALGELAARPGQLAKLVGQARLDEPSPDRIRELIDGLNDNRYEVRRRSVAELVKLGEAVAKPIRAAMKSPSSPDHEKLLREVLTRVTDQPIPAEELRLSRALVGMARSGGPETEAVLKGLLGRLGGHPLAEDVRACLRRLGDDAELPKKEVR